MSDASFIGPIHRRNYIFLLYGGSFTYVTHNSSIEEDFNEMYKVFQILQIFELRPTCLSCNTLNKELDLRRILFLSHIVP